jgi:flagellar L-ring protein precursor FlgH
MKKVFLTALTAVVLISSGAAAQQRLCGGAGESLFSNMKAYRGGDVIPVIIQEQSSASSNAKTDTKVKDEFSLGPGAGTLDFISLWGLDAENKYKGDAKTDRSGTLSARITVRITDLLENGDFRINGDREVVINGETEVITLSGIIRSRDIRADNTILSTYVANAKISYDGKGMIDAGHEPGLRTKFINWIP